MTTLRATADELDALAYGLAGTGFPGLGATLLTAATEAIRPLVARRLAGSLLLRGVVVPCAEAPADWQVAHAYRDLLETVLDPELAVAVRIRTPGASAMSIACHGAAGVVVHGAGPGGTHELRPCDTDLAGAVAGLLAVPDDLPELDERRPAPIRVRYAALLRHLAGEEPGPAVADLVDALARYRYAAKLILLGRRDGTYRAGATTLVAGAEGPLWMVAAEPDDHDGDGDSADGWVTARRIATADLKDWLSTNLRVR